MTPPSPKKNQTPAPTGKPQPAPAAVKAVPAPAPAAPAPPAQDAASAPASAPSAKRRGGDGQPFKAYWTTRITASRDRARSYCKLVRANAAAIKDGSSDADAAEQAVNAAFEALLGALSKLPADYQGVVPVGTGASARGPGAAATKAGDTVRLKDTRRKKWLHTFGPDELDAMKVTAVDKTNVTCDVTSRKNGGRAITVVFDRTSVEPAA